MQLHRQLKMNNKILSLKLHGMQPFIEMTFWKKKKKRVKPSTRREQCVSPEGWRRRWDSPEVTGTRRCCQWRLSVHPQRAPSRPGRLEAAWSWFWTFSGGPPLPLTRQRRRRPISVEPPVAERQGMLAVQHLRHIQLGTKNKRWLMLWYDVRATCLLKTVVLMNVMRGFCFFRGEDTSMLALVDVSKSSHCEENKAFTPHLQKYTVIHQCDFLFTFKLPMTHSSACTFITLQLLCWVVKVCPLWAWSFIKIS